MDIHSTQYKNVIKKIDSIFLPWSKNNSPGCALGIVQDGKTFYLQGYGMANLEYNIPNTSKIIYHIGSGSKPFTAVAILMLEQQGKLKINDDIHQYLPYVPDFGETITIKNLLQHTSGLRDQWDLCILGGWHMDDMVTQQQIINLVKLQKELNFKPGEEHLYCNTGYTLLAEIVKAVSGQNLREFTQEYIFSPLQMLHTHFHDDVEMVVPNRAYSYEIDDVGGHFKKSLLNYDNVGATSLFTNVEDMIKWNRNMDTGEIGGKELIEQLHEKTVLNNGKEIMYAFGLYINDYRGLKRIEYGGGDAGFRAYIGRYPEIDLKIVIFCNLGKIVPKVLSQKILDVFIEEKIVTLREDSIKKVEIRDDKAPKVLYQGNIEDWKDDIIGIYKTSPHSSLQLQFEKNQLTARVLDYSNFLYRLVQTGPKMYEDLENRFKLEIQIDEQNKFTGLIGYDPREFSLKKIIPMNLTKTQKVEYTGKYFSEELQIYYPIIIKTNKLVVSHHKKKEFELIPLEKDCFQGYRAQIVFTRGEGNAITGFQITSQRVRNLKFQKK